MTSQPAIRPGAFYLIRDGGAALVSVYVISTDARERVAIIRPISIQGDAARFTMRCPFSRFVAPLSDKETLQCHPTN